MIEKRCPKTPDPDCLGEWNAQERWVLLLKYKKYDEKVGGKIYKDIIKANNRGKTKVTMKMQYGRYVNNYVIKGKNT